MPGQRTVEGGGDLVFEGVGPRGGCYHHAGAEGAEALPQQGHDAVAFFIEQAGQGAVWGNLVLVWAAGQK